MEEEELEKAEEKSQRRHYGGQNIPGEKNAVWSGSETWIVIFKN